MTEGTTTYVVPRGGLLSVAVGGRPSGVSGSPTTGTPFAVVLKLGCGVRAGIPILPRPTGLTGYAVRIYPVKELKGRAWVG